MNRFGRCMMAGALLAALTVPARAQSPAPSPQPAPPATRATEAPQFVSPDVASDRRITFRVHGPNAEAVRLTASDMPGLGRNNDRFARAADGVWELTVGPLPPGAYRYNFNVDGVATIDPRNPAISESNNNVWSLVVVPGSDLFDTRDVPHGAVAEVTYKSSTLGRFRRMHVYTPPGYEAGRDRYPVFYLLHGAGDNDDAWTSVGRAGFILDNLIAANRARPMIVVMPAGHTSRGLGSIFGRAAVEEFVADFLRDVMPYVETHYRVLKDRDNTAVAGLSMGGGHALNVAIPHLERFGYVGVYSSGLLGAFGELAGRGGRVAAAPGSPAAPLTAGEWETQHAAKLSDPALKKGLRLLWFATGKDDFLLETTHATLKFLKQHGFAVVYKETAGGHTWLNWRDYLAEFAAQLFVAGRATQP